MPSHTVSHVTLLVSSGKFMSGSAFFLSPPENKKAKFAFCTLKRKGGSTQKQPFLTVRFRGALLTKSVTLEFSQDTVWTDNHQGHVASPPISPFNKLISFFKNPPADHFTRSQLYVSLQKFFFFRTLYCFQGKICLSISKWGRKTRCPLIRRLAPPSRCDNHDNHRGQVTSPPPLPTSHPVSIPLLMNLETYKNIWNTLNGLDKILLWYQLWGTRQSLWGHPTSPTI